MHYASVPQAGPLSGPPSHPPRQPPLCRCRWTMQPAVPAAIRCDLKTVPPRSPHTPPGRLYNQDKDNNDALAYSSSADMTGCPADATSLLGMSDLVSSALSCCPCTAGCIQPTTSYHVRPSGRNLVRVTPRQNAYQSSVDQAASNTRLLHDNHLLSKQMCLGKLNGQHIKHI